MHVKISMLGDWYSDIVYTIDVEFTNNTRHCLLLFGTFQAHVTLVRLGELSNH